MQDYNYNINEIIGPLESYESIKIEKDVRHMVVYFKYRNRTLDCIIQYEITNLIELHDKFYVYKTLREMVESYRKLSELYVEEFEDNKKEFLVHMCKNKFEKKAAEQYDNEKINEEIDKRFDNRIDMMRRYVVYKNDQILEEMYNNK